MVTRGLERFGRVRSGEIRSGKVRCGEAWLGLAVEAWQGRVRYGRVVRGLVN